MNNQLFNIFKGLWQITKFLIGTVIVITLFILGYLFVGGAFVSLGFMPSDLPPFTKTVLNVIFGVSSAISTVFISYLLSKFSVYVKTPHKINRRVYSMYCNTNDQFIKLDIISNLVYSTDISFMTKNDVIRIQNIFKDKDEIEINGVKVKTTDITITKYKCVDTNSYKFNNKL